MKFSAADWCFYAKAKNQDSYYQQLKKIGIDGVEMVEPGRWEQARKAGLEIVNLSGPGMQNGVNRRENHKELLPQIRDCISLAGDNGIPCIIVFSGNRNGQPDEEGAANCRSAFEQVLPFAEKANVNLLFEMLNSFDHSDYQADSGVYGFKLAKAVGSPRFKLLYDIYHMERMGYSAVAEIPENIDVIGHLHIAESPKRNIPAAYGNIRYGEIVPAALDAGYEGWWGLEFIPGKNSIPELETAVKRLSQK